MECGDYNDMVEYYEKHVACGPTHVVLAVVHVDDEVSDVAIFSNLKSAEHWVENINDATGATYTARIIDVPDYSSRHEMH